MIYVLILEFNPASENLCMCQGEEFKADAINLLHYSIAYCSPLRGSQPRRSHKHYTSKRYINK